MSFDLKIFGEKLRKCREQRKDTIKDLSSLSGISENDLQDFESGKKSPSGDQILIFADIFKCDFNYFISNEKTAVFEKTDLLFRKFSNQFSKSDRIAILEVLYLAECEEFLSKLSEKSSRPFEFTPEGKYFKEHGQKAAEKLRCFLKYRVSEVPDDIYMDIRTLGIHVFRRKFENSNISGIFVNHPTAGKCIVINYSEDIYRQRFSAAHELAHSIFDAAKEGYSISLSKWKKDDLVEIRANKFASCYLMPINVLKRIPASKTWDEAKAVEWANELKVSTAALSIALKQASLIDEKTEMIIRNSKVPHQLKVDPELSGDISDKGKKRKEELLKLGLSSYYVSLCFQAYRNGFISFPRMAEMMLLDLASVREIADIYKERIEYGG